MEKCKNNKSFILITCLITLFPMIAGLLLWQKLPEQIATHFGSGNVPNGWSSKGFTVFGIPLFILAAHLLCTFFTAVDPKRQHIDEKLYKIILLICPAVSLVCGISIYTYALSIDINIAFFVKIFVGLLFIFIGNYLPKCRQNYSIGIKLPWTLDSEENWNRTHRLAGWLWVVAGLLFLLTAFFHINSGWTFLIIAALLTFIPCCYSFLLYHKTNK